MSANPGGYVTHAVFPGGIYVAFIFNLCFYKAKGIEVLEYRPKIF